MERKDFFPVGQDSLKAAQEWADARHIDPFTYQETIREIKSVESSTYSYIIGMRLLQEHLERITNTDLYTKGAFSALQAARVEYFEKTGQLLPSTDEAAIAHFHYRIGVGSEEADNDSAVAGIKREMQIFLGEKPSVIFEPSDLYKASKSGQIGNCYIDPVIETFKWKSDASNAKFIAGQIGLANMLASTHFSTFSQPGESIDFMTGASDMVELLEFVS